MGPILISLHLFQGCGGIYKSEFAGGIQSSVKTYEECNVKPVNHSINAKVI